MNTENIARNILILDRLETLGHLFARENIPVIVLKGAALITAIPEYMTERQMEDIDLLVRPRDMARARAVFSGAGYRPAHNDPHAFHRGSADIAIDCQDSIWYLGRKENDRLWEGGTLVPLERMPGGLYRLSATDLYIHILAHAAVHHTLKEDKWLEDLKLIRAHWKEDIDDDLLEKKLRRSGLSGATAIFLHGHRPRTPAQFIYRWLLTREHPEGGHVSRFIFLPFKLKASYLMRSLFPPREFLIQRYRSREHARLLVYRVARPLLLLAKLLALPLRQ